MARHRKTSFDVAALANSSSKDDTTDDHVLGLATLGSGSRSQDGSTRSEFTKMSGTSSGQLAAVLTGTSAMDHLDALGLHTDDAGSIPSKDKSQNTETGGPGPVAAGTDDEQSGSGSGATLASSNQRLLLEALMGVTGSSTSGSQRRDRLESWGGMSDLSIAGIGDSGSLGKGGAHAAALAASALHHTGIIGDVAAAAAAMDCPPPNISTCAASLASSTSGTDHHAKVPSKISLTSDRKYSATSLSDTSAQTHTADGKEMAPDIQAFVAAAMATVGEQLKELAGTVESVASSTASIVSDKARPQVESRSRTGSLAEFTTLSAADVESTSDTPQFGRPRSQSTSSATKPIAVDYDAVEAAVNAAEAATCAIDLTSIANMATPSTGTGVQRKKNHRPLPLHRKGAVQPVEASATSSTCSTPRTPTLGPLHLLPIPQNTVSAKDMEAIRARARAAAGYIPPSEGGNISSAKRGVASGTARPPLKKRAKRNSPEPDRVHSLPAHAAKTPYAAASTYITPGKRANSAVGNTSTLCFPNTPAYSVNTPPSTVSSRGQSNQKWDDMFDCLLKFVEERREKELNGASDKEKEEWEWDGNVPTTYKTKEGKALGRWINNQRSAKHKGALKEEREARLVSTGLRWSVLTTNSWSDMLNELKIFVQEKTKDGGEWDGNVPTNYRIKSNTVANGTDLDEDKNLGRWINRQRSLYQAGKLKKERQVELEKIGLKWSVLSTTSWQSMYEALCDYVKDKKAEDPNNEWDGNVPANHKTDGTPPLSLGRWVNRQRSAYAKQKLKQEFIDKLNMIGLKWAVHERRTPVSDIKADANGVNENENSATNGDGTKVGYEKASATSSETNGDEKKDEKSDAVMN